MKVNKVFMLIISIVLLGILLVACNYNDTTATHQHTIVIDEAVSPTCTSTGLTEGKHCSECGEVLTKQEIVGALGHTEVIDEAIVATCQATGLTEGKHCSVCNAVIVAQQIVEKKEHTVVIDSAVSPTCTSMGLTEGKHCSTCGEILVTQIEVPMIDHTPGTAATCTQNQTCTECGKILVSVNGHVPGINASCVEPQRCTVCKIVLVEATGHNLSYIAERDPVNVNDPGNRDYWQCSKCNRCYIDDSATQEIAVADTIWKVYSVSFYDLENNMYFSGVYKQSEPLFLENITPIEMRGYDFNGWHMSQNFAPENAVSVIPAGNSQNIILYANRSLHKYKITLLGIGREETWYYNVVEGIKLTTPKWKESAGGGDCLIFSHWSDENGVKITEIPAGEIGDRTIEANWIYKENYVVSNADKYTYVNGVMDQYGRYSFIYEIGVIKDIVLSKQHSYSFDGLTEHIESETKTYTVGASSGQEVAKIVSNIVSNSSEMANISKHTKTHTEGWEIGAKWKPEVEFLGIKVSAWEFSGGYSKTDTDVYENTGFSSEKNYEENGMESEVRSTIDYYTEESVSRTVSETFIPGVTPVGNYTWARLMDVKVYAIVTYNPYTGNYVFDIYSVPTNIHDGLLYTLPSGLEYDINIVSGDILDFEIPFEDIPDMFYTVEYDANGGIGEMPKSVHELGLSSLLLKNEFIKDGYAFAGWNTSPDGKGITYSDEFRITNNIAPAGGKVILYAQWEAMSYTITFNANGGTVGTSKKTVTFDESYSTLPTPVRPGYTFEGWKYGDEIITSDTKIRVSDDHTLLAQWQANTYMVFFDANGGFVDIDSAIKTFDSAYGILPTPTRLNCEFGGWYSGDNKIDSNSIVQISGGHTLRALWIPCTSGYWDTGSRNETVTTSGRTEYWQTGLNREALKAAGYTEFTIYIEMNGKFKSSDWFKADWWFEIYDPSGNMVVEENEEHWKTSWEQREYTHTISIDTIRDDGTILVWYDHGGDDADDFSLGTVRIWTTAK